jgi:hypothetical protein
MCSWAAMWSWECMADLVLGCGAGTVIRTGCSALAVRQTPGPGIATAGGMPSAVFGRRRAAGIGTVAKAYAFRDPGTATGDR